MSAICPGYVWTPLVQKQIPDTVKARGITEDQVISEMLLHSHSTQKFVQMDEVAAFALFLSSDCGADCPLGPADRSRLDGVVTNPD